MTVKIIGFDESGGIGSDHIIFTQVEFNEENEADLFIHNILNSGDFFYEKNKIRGWDKKKKIKSCRNLLNHKLIKLKFYKLNPYEQNKISQDIFKYQAEFLFQERERLIQFCKKKPLNNYLSHLIAQMHHYRNYALLPEFCLKSYSYLYILNKLCIKNTTNVFLGDPNNLLKIQIDGGNVFTFWWFDLLNSQDNKEKLQKMIINGIAHGDQYYLSMNIAELLAKTFKEDIHFFLNYPIEDIIYDFSEINFSKDTFYERVWSSLKNYYFKNRIIFIGWSELSKLIPYILHREQRTIIYEPFRPKGDIKDYFRYFKIGSPEKNIVIFGSNLSRDEKQNLDYCREKGLITKPVEEFKDKFLDFFNKIEETVTNYYGIKIKNKVLSTLEKYRSSL
ncbi:MAG: hypothetical protein ACTSRI_19990 [Promethearchaeota archaeon]